MALPAFVPLLFTMGALGLAVPPASPAAAGSVQRSEGRKHVLLLYDENKDTFPGLGRIDRRLRESMQSEFRKAVDFYTESLDLSQFQRPGYDQILADYYQRKYAGKAIDLIVAVMEPSLDFLLQHGEALFPAVPIVFCGVEASTIAAKKLRPNITGFLVKRSFAPTLDLALRLQPRTHNVFVVGGAAPFDRYLEDLARRDLKPYEGRLTIAYLFGLPIDALTKAVSSLPPDSVILFTTLFADGAGRAFVPHESMAAIAAAANAPMYVALDQYVGGGAVGGKVYSVDTHGSEAAELGLRILRGAAPSTLPVRELGSQIDLFDARQLRRWKLDDTRLPPGTVILFRDPTVWQRYRWYIVGTIAVVLFQSALIAGLLLARMRRRRAEEEARRQREELAHVLRVTTLSELTTSLAHEISQPLGAITVNAEAARRLLRGEPSQAGEVSGALSDIAADAQRASQIIQRLRALFRKEHVKHVAVDVNTLVEDVVSLLHATMQDDHIEVRLLLAEPSPAVLGDPVQLEQVLLNVVMNACEGIGATRDGPCVITIRTRQLQRGRLALEIEDTGVGVGAAELEHIFEHFVTTKPQGLGMGLAISRSIVSAHGGRIWATANPDRGLTVHIDLPSASDARSAAIT